MRGSYEYAPIKMMLSKIVTDKTGRTDPQTLKPLKEQVFIEGDYIAY